MGGHHGPELPKIPDWRIYKVEDCPRLVELQKALAVHGLKDPWLRNEVWKFKSVKKGPFESVKSVLKIGFKYGLVAAILTAAIDYAFFPLREAPHYEGQSHH